jgi:hypothetical protein
MHKSGAGSVIRELIQLREMAEFCSHSDIPAYIELRWEIWNKYSELAEFRGWGWDAFGDESVRESVLEIDLQVLITFFRRAHERSGPDFIIPLIYEFSDLCSRSATWSDIQVVCTTFIKEKGQGRYLCAKMFFQMLKNMNHKYPKNAGTIPEVSALEQIMKWLYKTTNAEQFREIQMWLFNNAIESDLKYQLQWLWPFLSNPEVQGSLLKIAQSGVYRTVQTHKAREFVRKIAPNLIFRAPYFYGKNKINPASFIPEVCDG